MSSLRNLRVKYEFLGMTFKASDDLILLTFQPDLLPLLPFSFPHSMLCTYWITQVQRLSNHDPVFVNKNLLENTTTLICLYIVCGWSCVCQSWVVPAETILPPKPKLFPWNTLSYSLCYLAKSDLPSRSQLRSQFMRSFHNTLCIYIRTFI